jgi:ribosomal protein S18 acetylase RimI-like enzyme
MGQDVTDDTTLYERMMASMEVAYPLGLQRLSAPAGVIAGRCPEIPQRSVFNCVVYRDPEALVEALPDLARQYEEAGTIAWTVWVPERDARVRQALEAAGHVLDGTPEAMAAPLEEVDCDAGAEGLDWERPDGLEEMGAILGEAFSWSGEPIAAVLDGVKGVGHLYVARVDGRPAGCVGAVDVDGDAGIYWVGTLPEARGRGVATGLMRQALLDARERGCTSTSLQATVMGRPVYRRLGYRELGPIEMWERRRT